MEEKEIRKETRIHTINWVCSKLTPTLSKAVIMRLIEESEQGVADWLEDVKDNTTD